MLLLALGALARDRFDQWIAATRLPALVPANSIQVLDRNGQLLRAYTVADGRWRLPLSTAEVDPAFLDLLITYEDRRFLSHGGVDPRAILRAAWQMARQGQVVSGGSTLTMQVARLLEQSGTGRFAGKLRQIRVALALERRLSKRQILDLYLQLAPYGGNLEGLRAASLAYFGKEPRRLTPAERALLVALPQSPEARRPDRHAAAAEAARSRVLARALAFGLITPDEAQAAGQEPVPRQRRPFPALAPHVADRARAEAPGRSEHRLALDAGVQRQMEDLAREVLAAKSERVQIALLVADHRSAEILASVGSAEFTDDRRAGYLDMTRAFRSPGSTLKPLVYGLAFDQGLAHPETLIEDRPIDFSGYRPTNFDRQYRGTLRLREALQLSLNIPVVALTSALGPVRLTTALDQAGADYRIPPGEPGLAISLGGIGVTLEGMVSLYAGLAHGGLARPLVWYPAAPGTGAPGGPIGQRLISEPAAWQVGDILSGMAPPPGAPRNRLAYKTGTSYGHRDAWAIGFDGAHVIGIWMGRPDGTPVPGAFGADQAAPVLFHAFGRLKPQLTPLPPPPAATLLVANAQLPPPLRRFRPREAPLAEDPLSPRITFPPAGAEVELMPEGFLARIEGGSAPFVWLVNGSPVAKGIKERSLILPNGTGRGFVILSVVDALGRSSRIAFRLR